MMAQSYAIPFDEELLPIRNLTFGNFSCTYEHGRIRYVKLGDTEVIRMIYFAVRDQDWKTADYTIKNEFIQDHSNGFVITYTALHQLHDITYSVDVKIEALNNSLVFEVNGEARSSFKRNRIGICVLHPVKECRGREVYITRPDGTGYDSRFPDLISPHQPFTDIRNLQCKVGDEISVSFQFEGDIFEAEDQRNWADSSFKTYSTPLHVPMPVAVHEGERLNQKVSIQIDGSPTSQRNVYAGERKIAFPQIGYASALEDLEPSNIDILRHLPFDHYRLETSLFAAGWERFLNQKIEEARELKTRIELVVVFSENIGSELEELLAAMERSNRLIGSILLLQKGKPVMAKENFVSMYKKIKHRYPSIKVGYGTNGFFADINRNRPSFHEFDFVSFSVNPQVHSSDTRSLLENLQQLQDLVQTARSFSGDKEIHISPITFKIREQGGLDGDARQHRNFGAIWTLVAMKNLAAANRLTFYQATGYRGILQPGETPLVNLLRLIKTFNPKWIIEGTDNTKLLPDEVVFENDHGERLRIDFKKL